jgi:hypothetical protein
MIKTPNLFHQLEQRIIDACELKSTNETVFIAFLLVRKYMQDMGWPEEVQSETDSAVKMFSRLIDGLDYAKIKMQAGLLPSKKPYCEECICKAYDRGFTCPHSAEDKSDCALVTIAKRLKKEIC